MNKGYSRDMDIIMRYLCLLPNDGIRSLQFQKAGLPQASHNKLGEFWPIPPDRAGITESGL
jgi:hypothetical protein